MYGFVGTIAWVVAVIVSMGCIRMGSYVTGTLLLYSMIGKIDSEIIEINL